MAEYSAPSPVAAAWRACGNDGEWAIAASVFFTAAILWLLVNNTENEKPKRALSAIPMKERVTQRGQKLTLKLSDGSRVHLNAQTKLVFPDYFSQAERAVTLVYGETFFEIAHDSKRPFLVRTRGAVMNVLGTSFNVHASDEDITIITLVDGKVNVNAAEGHTTLAPASQAVVASNGEISVHEHVNVDALTSWKDNTLTFEHTTLAEAVRQLEDWYGVNITLTNTALRKCIITATFKDETLLNVLKSFHFMLGIQFRMNGKEVLIQGKGCTNGKPENL